MVYHDKALLFVGGLGSIRTQRLLSIENKRTALLEIPTNLTLESKFSLV